MIKRADGNADPVEAAKAFIHEYYPRCLGAILAGSVVRGEETPTSDLDIIVFDEAITASYRESLIAFDWAIEVFVHNATSYKQFFESDRNRARPTLPRMVSEGIILKNNGLIDPIKREAEEILANGPEQWSEKTVETKRYFITDALDDLIGSTNRAEELFIVNTLAERVSEFVLRTNNQWTGSSKWVIRSLSEYDEEFAEAFIEAFDIFYRTGEKNSVIELVDDVLDPYGGRLFVGFSLGKE